MLRPETTHVFAPAENAPPRQTSSTWLSKQSQRLQNRMPLKWQRNAPAVVGTTTQSTNASALDTSMGMSSPIHLRHRNHQRKLLRLRDLRDTNLLPTASPPETRSNDVSKRHVHFYVAWRHSRALNSARSPEPKSQSTHNVVKEWTTQTIHQTGFYTTYELFSHQANKTTQDTRRHGKQDASICGGVFAKLTCRPAA